VWAPITADPVAGLAYLPVETPTIDEYGGNRPGNNLFAESLVAVDLKTGVRKWHFQLVHHPLWDMDISSAPLLIDATIDGKPRKLVCQPTKQGWLYTFDRITGEPIWPIVEKPVPQSDVPGEKTAATQPFVTKPPPYSRNYVATDDVIDFTPALHAQALQNLKAYRWEQTPFIPPVYTGPGGKWAGAINVGNTGGGINWPGASFDPETAIFYGQAANAGVTTGSFSKEEIDLIGVENQSKPGNRIPWWESPYGRAGRPGAVGRGEAGAAPARGAGAPAAGGAAPARGAGAPAGGGGGGRGAAGGGGGRGGAPQAGAAPAGGGGGGGGGRGALTQGLEGLPIVKPPYGVLAAIDLNTGTMKFRVPHGETPDTIRETFARLGINYPERTGQSGSTGLMVTKTMVVVGDLQVTAPPGRPKGAMLRAYDKQTGKEIGAVLMPDRISGSPMTYMGSDGRQYINVAITGGAYNPTGTYVTYALPAAEIRPTTGGQ
jgi:quinoprotein glucose dehydrogenase